MTTITHETKPLDMRGSIWISWPCSFTGGEKSKTCRALETLMNTDARPKCLPGQILSATGGPVRTCTDSNICCKMEYSPSAETERELARILDVWVSHAVAKETLGAEHLWVLVHCRIMEACPTSSS